MSPIEASLHRVLSAPSPHLGDVFYSKFLAACPAAAEFFRNTDIKAQGHILVNSLQVVVALTEHRYPAAVAYLKLVGHRHHLRNIPRELYVVWRDVMLSTLRETQADEWSDELERDWRNAIDAAAEAMFEGYIPGPVFC